MRPEVRLIPVSTKRGEIHFMDEIVMAYLHLASPCAVVAICTIALLSYLKLNSMHYRVISSYKADDESSGWVALGA